MYSRTILSALLLVASTAALADSTPRIDRVQTRQVARIQHGVASGALTAPETRRLAHQERSLARHEAWAKSDGDVTQAERRRLNRDAARTSRAIHRQAHDGQTRN
ncbi:MAG: hypothetical protein U1F09_15560 [Steroidobacteraceae bacterium]